jgi:chaperonin GroES
MSKKMKVEREYRPVGGRVMVEPDAAEAESEGGIVFAESAKELPLTGTVLAVCPTVKDHVQPGDRVCWGNMYQITLPKQPDKRDLVVLRFPEEILFLYKDVQVEESDAEYAARLAEVKEAAEATKAWNMEKEMLRRNIQAQMGGANE